VKLDYTPFWLPPTALCPLLPPTFLCPGGVSSLVNIHFSYNHLLHCRHREESRGNRWSGSHVDHCQDS
jgi:hypothetical protein